MVSSIIRKQVEDIRKQYHTILELFSILVLVLVVILFVFFWFSDFWISGLYWIEADNLGVTNTSWVELNYYIIKLILSLGFLIFTVLYFWWVQNKRQFHVLFIECKEEQKLIDTERLPTLILISIVISIPLSIIAILQEVLRYDWWDIDQLAPLWRSFEHPYWHDVFHTIPPIGYPVIAFVCSSIALYVAYRIAPVRLQENLILLLYIPLILSFLAVFWQTYYLLLDQSTGWYVYILKGTSPPVGTIPFTRNVVFVLERTLMLTSFILLLYLTCRINVEYNKFSSFVKEERLRDVIDNGVAILPKKVHMGDSYNVPLDLTLSECFTSCYSHYASGYHYKRLSTDYLEAALQAVGLEVDGEKRVRIYETSPIPVTTWDCRFAESGVYTINLMIHLIKPPSNSRELIFMQTHNVKVNSFLTTSLVPLLAIVIPLLAALVQALIAILLKKGIS